MGTTSLNAIKMPGYQGGKSQLGGRIYNVMCSMEEKLGWHSKQDIFFEPFCGMLGVGIHAAKDGRKLIACDANQDLIKMWQALQQGWMPEQNECSKVRYEELKVSQVSSPERAFFGIACAYNGVYFAGYSPFVVTKGVKYSRVRMLKNVLQKRVLPYLENTTFLNARDYRKFNKLSGMTIYVDPPYLNNDYGKTNEHFQFDHDIFWKVMRRWSKKNLVFISEYTAPDDFAVVWQKSVHTSHTGKSRHDVEKLFMLKN